jgi:hypothetical protein
MEWPRQAKQNGRHYPGFRPAVLLGGLPDGLAVEETPLRQQWPSLARCSGQAIPDSGLSFLSAGGILMPSFSALCDKLGIKLPFCDRLSKV